MVREGCRSHRGFSSYRSLYPEEQKDLQIKKKTQKPEVRKNQMRIKLCSLRGEAATPLPQPLISAGDVSPEGSTWLQRPRPELYSAKTPALSLITSRAAPGTHRHRGRRWGTTALADGGHRSWICSIPRRHPHTAWAKQAPATPGQARGFLKNGDSPAEPAPATVSRGGIFTFCVFLGISGTCPIPPIGPLGKTGEVQSSAELTQGGESPETLLATGLPLSCGAEALGVHG